MDINPQEVIKHLANEVARLTIDNAVLKAALEAKENTETDGGKEA